jgi:hypothetical protein
MRIRSQVPVLLGCLVLVPFLNCTRHLQVDHRAELTGTKVWAEADGTRITVVMRLPHPEGVQPPRVASLDEPFDFVRRELPGATEVRFSVPPERLGPKRTIRLSVDFGGAPLALVLEGPVRTANAEAANAIFWTVVTMK